MTDDLVERLRDERVTATRTEAADRIEELEAQMAKVVEALKTMVDQNGYADDPWGIVRTTLAELKGDSDE